MPEYDNTNTIVLFQNDQKGNDKAPVLKGKINVNGVELEVALWGRTSKSSGEKFWSGEISEPYQKAEPAGVGATSDDIPF